MGRGKGWSSMTLLGGVCMSLTTGMIIEDVIITRLDTIRLLTQIRMERRVGWNIETILPALSIG